MASWVPFISKLSRSLRICYVHLKFSFTSVHMCLCPQSIGRLLQLLPYDLVHQLSRGNCTSTSHCMPCRLTPQLAIWLTTCRAAPSRHGKNCVVNA